MSVETHDVDWLSDRPLAETLAGFVKFSGQHGRSPSIHSAALLGSVQLLTSVVLHLQVSALGSSGRSFIFMDGS